MRHLKFRVDQSFVIMVGIAALIHSTWSIATFSSGEAPALSGDPAAIASWLIWCVPGFLAAFALEVGQVETARQIKRGQGRRLHFGKLTINMKVVTFIVLSAGTYLFQLVYLLHHFPNLPLSAGLSQTSQLAAKTVMEIVVWGSPLLLPLTMWMSVASDGVESMAREIHAADSDVPLHTPIEVPDAVTDKVRREINERFLSMSHLSKTGNGNGNRE